MIGTIVLWIIVGIFLALWLAGAIIGFIGNHFWWFLLGAGIFAFIAWRKKNRNV